MAYEDLRDWLKQVDGFGEILRLNGADWNIEIGGLCDVIVREAKKNVPAILFDEIQGYPKGVRALFAMLSSIKRLALTVNLPLECGDMMDFVRAFHQKSRDLQLIPPVTVKQGPVAENVMEGDRIDLYKFPSPFHHEKDGGRYFGTAHCVITQDPETGHVNLGTYRCMLFDKSSVGLHMSPGRHGRTARDKFFDRSEPFKVAVAVGADPALFLSSTQAVAAGGSEDEFCGGLKRAPLAGGGGPYNQIAFAPPDVIVIASEWHPGGTGTAGRSWG